MLNAALIGIIVTDSEPSPTFPQESIKCLPVPAATENEAPAPLIIVTPVPPATVTALLLKLRYLKKNMLLVVALGIAATICAAVAVVSDCEVPRLRAKNVPSISCAAVIV